MKKITLFSLIILFTWQLAVAQESNSKETVEKKESVPAKSVEENNQVFSHAQDTINGNQQIIHQEGTSVSIINQSGSENVLEVIQKDSSNVSTIIQSGNGNRIKVRQSSYHGKRKKTN